MLVFACSKSAEKPIKRDAAPTAQAPADAAAVAPATDAAESPNKITITVAKPKPPGSGFAKRCAIGGPPLETKCIGGSMGIALDKTGMLLANEEQLHRFTVTTDGECKLAPSGEPIAMPPNNPRPQKVGGGPMYMRSGGPAWDLVQTPDAIYALDFLAGLFRLRGDKLEPACTELFGFRTIVKAGKRWLGLRQGVEEITLGKAGKCKAQSAKIDDKARELFAVGDKTFTKLDDLGVKICSATAMTACGDGACILDHNCAKIVQLAADGSVARTIEGDKLFDTRPSWLGAAVTASDGTVFLRAVHRDKVGDKDVCETAVYAIPPAVFAR